MTQIAFQVIKPQVETLLDRWEQFSSQVKEEAQSVSVSICSEVKKNVLFLKAICSHDWMNPADAERFARADMHQAIRKSKSDLRQVMRRWTRAKVTRRRLHKMDLRASLKKKVAA